VIGCQTGIGRYSARTRLAIPRQALLRPVPHSTHYGPLRYSLKLVVEYTPSSTELIVEWLFYAIHLRQVFEKMGFSALTGAKTDDNGGFSKPLPYVFAARRTVGQMGECGLLGQEACASWSCWTIQRAVFHAAAKNIQEDFLERSLFRFHRLLN